MSKKKSYLIETLIKLIKQDEITKSMLDYQFLVFKGTYSYIPNDEFVKIKEKYNKKEHLSSLHPIIDKHFSEEELQQLVEFHSSPLSKKMYSNNFNLDLQNASAKFIADIENELTPINIKYQKEKNNEKNE